MNPTAVSTDLKHLRTAVIIQRYSIVGLVGADLLKKVPEIAASTGSACHEGQIALSPVLAAMGVDADRSLRASVGWSSTDETYWKENYRIWMSALRRSGELCGTRS